MILNKDLNTAEAYIEPKQTFSRQIFLQKSCIIDIPLVSKIHLCRTSFIRMDCDVLRYLVPFI